MVILLFWICLATVACVYAGYPLLLVAGLLGRRELKRECTSNQPENDTPLLSVIVAAHNEESSIEAKIKNILASDYQRDRLEILIGSDGSSDRTEEIVRKYVNEGVGLISFPQQHGKSAMQNGLVAAASGSILIFTDADCLISASALRSLVENFDDFRVGLVTGCPQYANEGETAVTRNESAYLHYETWLREQESARGILAMASGSLFALRRSLWQPLEADLGDDFVLPLRVTAANKLNVLEPRVVSVTSLAQDKPGTMFSLKVRIISKDFRALLRSSRVAQSHATRLACSESLAAQTAPLVRAIFPDSDVRCKSVSARSAFVSRFPGAAGRVLCYRLRRAFLARACGALPLVGSHVLLRGERCGVARYFEMSRGPEVRPMDAATKTIRRNAQRPAGEPPCRLRKSAARSS